MLPPTIGLGLGRVDCEWLDVGLDCCELGGTATVFVTRVLTAVVTTAVTSAISQVSQLLRSRLHQGEEDTGWTRGVRGLFRRGYPLVIVLRPIGSL